MRSALCDSHLVGDSQSNFFPLVRDLRLHYFRSNCSAYSLSVGSSVRVTIKREEVCQNNKPSRRQEKTPERENPHPRRPGRSSGRRCTTSVRASTAQGRASGQC